VQSSDTAILTWSGTDLGVTAKLDTTYHERGLEAQHHMNRLIRRKRWLVDASATDRQSQNAVDSPHI